MFGFDQQQRRVLHLTWIAFFLTFVAWFNLAPFNTTLIAVAELTPEHIKILMVCNVALTIPARIVIGSLVDHFGPRRVFVALLVFAGAVSGYFALAQSFHDFVLSRLLMGIVGAGFVVGVKMIGDWFPPENMGTAQGIYAGWGNFGAAAAALTLPGFASLFSPENGWRIASALTGTLCLIWAFVYFKFAEERKTETAKFRLGLEHTIEVSSKKDLALQCLLLLPLYVVLAQFVNKLAVGPRLLCTDASSGGGCVMVGTEPLLTSGVASGLIMGFVFLYFYNIWTCMRYNLPRIASGPSAETQYAFKQVVILSLVYALTFGSQLAVVSMFPEFLETTFSLSVAVAGVLGSSFAFFNLVTRPAGGWLSDRFGRKQVLSLIVFGAGVCYFLMGQINSGWPIVGVLLLAVLCSVFIQVGTGACFSMVPLIRKDLTGKLAGMVGAYGNVGAVFFLSILSFMTVTTFFTWIGVFSFCVLASLFFLDSFEQQPASIKSNNGV